MKTQSLLPLMLCIVIGIAACAASPEPYEYRPENELKPGPGLFSGENGEFTIFRVPEKAGQEKDHSRQEPKGDNQNESP